MCPTEFDYKSARIQLTKNEAVFLKEQFTSCIAMHNSLLDYSLNEGVVEDDFLNISCTEIKDSGAENLAEYVRLAQEFSLFFYGPQIVYNLIFSEGRDEEAYDKWKKEYFEWKNNYFDGVGDIPDLDKTLMLLDGYNSKHAAYSISLQKFIRDFCTAVESNPVGECSEREKDLVRKREKEIKKNKSKLDKPDYEYKPATSNRLTFRHDTAKVIINDILKGLEDNENA